MAKPYRHAMSSAAKYGGTPEDYLDIHDLMDSSKAAMADNRHRALTHNAWFIGTIVERMFGTTRLNSEGKLYCVRDIAEQHVLEDFGFRFIPTAQDYLQGIPFEDWMQNGLKGHPPSAKELVNHGRNQGRDRRVQGPAEAGAGNGEGEVRGGTASDDLPASSPAGVV